MNIFHNLGTIDIVYQCFKPRPLTYYRKNGRYKLSMKYQLYILALAGLALLLSGCPANSTLSDAEVETKAIFIAHSLDSADIQTFRTWSHVPRGQAGIWYRNSGDSSLYQAVYIAQAESTELYIMGQEEFNKDFSSALPLDTSQWRIIFTKASGGKLKITGTNQQGQDVLVANSVNQASIFPKEDPFDQFQKLTDLKNDLGFFGVYYYEDLGGKIEFQLSAEHVLTYIPDVNKIEPPFRQVWISNFEKGKWIKENWNLRKLDKPLDGA